MARRTKNINGHRRMKRRGAPQFSTVSDMLQAKADKCKADYDSRPIKPHQCKDQWTNPFAELLAEFTKRAENLKANTK